MCQREQLFKLIDQQYKLALAIIGQDEPSCARQPARVTLKLCAQASRCSWRDAQERKLQLVERMRARGQFGDKPALRARHATAA